MSIGVKAVLKSREIGNVYLAKQLEVTEELKEVRRITQTRKIPVHIVEQGNTIIVDPECRIQILHPQQEKIVENSSNNNSIVCMLTYQKTKILFTGDIEKIAEEKILNQINLPQVDILKIAHHGSDSSTTKEWIGKTKPTIALIGVGKQNRYQHPSKEVLERLRQNKVKTYRTDQDGEIEISIFKDGTFKIKKQLE